MERMDSSGTSRIEDNPLKNLNPEDLEKIIKLNTFLEEESDNENVDIRKINSEDLLGSEEQKKIVEENKEKDGYFDNFPIDEILKNTLDDNFRFEVNDQYITIHSDNIENDLPNGYGFKGGKAREQLRKTLGLTELKARDIDVIRFCKEEPYEGSDEEIALKYMPQDYAHGDGVEVVHDLEEYLDSRDFTINEVCVLDNKLIVTESCIRDTLRGVIRVTDFEVGVYSPNYHDDIGPKMKAKSLRLLVEQQVLLGGGILSQDDFNRINGGFITPFWIAVQLDRAYEVSPKIASSFMKVLVDLELVPEDIENLKDLVDYIEDRMYDDGFQFRNIPWAQYRYEEDYFNKDNSNDETEILEKYFDIIYHGSRY